VDAGIVPGAIEWHVEATRGGYVAPRRLFSSMDHDANISATSNSSADFVELTGIDISAG